MLPEKEFFPFLERLRFLFRIYRDEIKREPCENHGLSRNCNSPFKEILNKDFANTTVLLAGWEGAKIRDKSGYLPPSLLDNAFAKKAGQ